MRYLALIIAAFIVMTTTSCVKTYTCVCEVEWHDNGKVTKETETDEVPGINRKSAQESCDAGDDDELTNGFGVTRQCELQ